MTNIEAVANIIKEAEGMRNCYFWTPASNASGRRYYEAKHSHELVEWTENGHTFTAEFTVSCSCKNIYAKGTYTKDGKTTTLTAIKNSYKRMTAC